MVEKSWPAYEQVKIQLRDYLLGSLSTGLLLTGMRGLPMLEDAKEVASSILSCDSGKLDSHPDYVFLTVPDKSKSIGVDDVSVVTQKARLFPSRADKIVVLIDNFDKMTVDAQNRLLKLIEECLTVVVIGVGYEDNALPTIKSRMRVIPYQPMDKRSYLLACGGDDRSAALAGYFVSGGIIGNEPDEELLSFFRNVATAIDGGNLRELIPALQLLNEKDSSSFFNLYRNYAGAMVSFIGQLLVDKGATDNMWLIAEHQKMCSSSMYTKDDFFSLIISLIEGGKSNEFI